jgi:hypothetical protein
MGDFSNLGFEKGLIIIVCLAALVGWAGIEFILWLFSFITISIN